MNMTSPEDIILGDDNLLCDENKKVVDSNT